MHMQNCKYESKKSYLHGNYTKLQIFDLQSAAPHPHKSRACVPQTVEINNKKKKTYLEGLCEADMICICNNEYTICLYSMFFLS